MGSRGKILFDLNELPTEEECHNSSPTTLQPESPQPPTSSNSLDLYIPGRSNPNITIPGGSTPNLSTPDTGSNQGLLNNHAFKHASTGSLFQPFIRNKDISSNEDLKPVNNNDGSKGAEREEGEWSDIDGNTEVAGSNNAGNEERESDKGDSSSTAEASKDGSVHGGDAVVKREVKGVEASYALKFSSNPMKRSRIDEQKEEKLGKRRPRKTVFINVEDAKQAGPMKGSTPKRQTSFPTPIITRTIKEKQTLKQSDATSIEGTEVAGELNGDPNGDLQNASRSGSWKQFMESKQPPKGSSGSSASVPSKKMGPTNTDLKPGNVKKHFSSSTSKKQLISYQDTSVERLIREVTSEKFWHNPGIL
jgi:senataxin